MQPTTTWEQITPWGHEIQTGFGVPISNTRFSWLDLSPDISIALKWKFYIRYPGRLLLLSELQIKQHFPREQTHAGNRSDKRVTQETDLINALWSCMLDRPVLWVLEDRDLKHMLSREQHVGARSKMWVRSSRWKINFHFQGTKIARANNCGTKINQSEFHLPLGVKKKGRTSQWEGRGGRWNREGLGGLLNTVN